MTPVLANLLLAVELEEVVGALVPLIILAIWIAKQIFATKNEAQQQAAQPAQRRPEQHGQAAQPAAGQAAAAQAGQQADPLRDQVEEFLRRSGRAGQQQNQPSAARRAAQPAAEQIEILIEEEPPRPGRGPLSEPLRPLAEREGPAAPRRARRAGAKARKSVAEHVAQHVAAGSQSLGAQASKLGQRIIADDAQFDEQLKAKFDHEVGTLAASRPREAEEPAAPRDEPAAQIAAMLASPSGVRQAVILNEILHRPSDQW